MRADVNLLRAELAQIHDQLIEAEAELADQMVEINAFEHEFEAKVGYLIDQLEALESDIGRYNERIQIARNKETFGYAHVSVEQQYQRTWQAPPPSAPAPPPAPLSPANQAEIKRLYRRLARRFHPDLATSEADRLGRTKKMTAINDAYAARSLVELVAMSQELDHIIDSDPHRSGQTEIQMVQALEEELARCRRRLRHIERELRNLRFKSSVEVSLEVTAARRQGRDLLEEMASDLAQRIARKTVERDMLRAQFDQLGPDAGFIEINR